MPAPFLVSLGPSLCIETDPSSAFARTPKALSTASGFNFVQNSTRRAADSATAVESKSATTDSDFHSRAESLQYLRSSQGSARWNIIRRRFAGSMTEGRCTLSPMRLTRTAGSRVLVAAAIAVLALSASACGGGKKSTTTNGLAATQQWAGGVCSAFTTWTKSLRGIQSSLKGGGISSLSSTALKQAATKAEDATKTLVQSLKDLGVPQTANSQAAKTNLTSLQNTLSQGVTNIQNALKSSSSAAGAVTALSTVAAEFATMANALTKSVDNLKKIEPGSDLEQAFKQAPSCSAYVSSTS
jgi:hypothetical protein